MFKPYNNRFFLSIIVLLFSLNSLFSQNIDHWEMLIAADDTWHFFPGNSEPPADWPNIGFNTSNWSTGKGGIGYGDGDDGTTIAQVPSVYLRINFDIITKENIAWASLDVDYDDAFVAYLNGHEIARANIGTVGIRPSYSTYASNYREAQMYSGGKPERFLIQPDTLLKYLNEGNNVLALQVHNYNAESSDLSSIAFLSLGISNSSTDYRTVPSWFDAHQGCNNVRCQSIQTSVS